MSHHHRSTPRPPAALWATALLAALFTGGCASVQPDAGFAAVQHSVQGRLGQPLPWARSEAEQAQADQRVRALLAQPLGVDDAVLVALLNNRGLQASLQDLVIADAERVQDSRLPNPGFSFGRLQRGHEVELERGLHLGLARLIALPYLRQLAERRFGQTQALVALQVLALAADTRRAYYMAVAAEETVRYMRQVKQAAEASAELARRMAQVGNFNALQRAREQLFHADAAVGLARAEQAQRATRERLTRLLGAWGDQTRFTLPERLPDLPKQVLDLPDIEGQALAQRLDVQGARLAAEHTAQQLGLTRSTRIVNLLELGVVRNGSNEAPTQRGWEVAIELPIFDGGGARLARAEALYQQALHRAAETAVNARSEVREAYTAYRSAYDLARYQRDELVPISQRISEENLLRYNGMLIGVFELLADARAQMATVHGAIQAQRDFWLAQADLDLAMVGKPSLAVSVAPIGSTPAADAAGAGH